MKPSVFQPLADPVGEGAVGKDCDSGGGLVGGGVVGLVFDGLVGKDSVVGKLAVGKLALLGEAVGGGLVGGGVVGRVVGLVGKDSAGTVGTEGNDSSD